MFSWVKAHATSIKDPSPSKVTSNFYEALIRRCVLRCLIWVCSVCLYPTKGFQCLYGLKLRSFYNYDMLRRNQWLYHVEAHEIKCRITRYLTYSYLTFQIVYYNKGADQTVGMCKLVCTFVVRRHQHKVSSSGFLAYAWLCA